MAWPRLRWLIVSLALCVGAMPTRAAPVTLAEVGLPPLQLKVLRRVSLSVNEELNRSVGFLAKGQPVTVRVWSGELAFVEARISTGPARGWVLTEHLEPPPAGFLADLARRVERQQRHRELSARHEIAVGMTAAEVVAALGQPVRKQTVRTAADGAVEQWAYSSYRYLPRHEQITDATGQTRPTISYRRTPAGQRILTFRDGQLIRIAAPQAISSPAR